MIKAALALLAFACLTVPTHAAFFTGVALKRMCDEGFADQYVTGIYDAYEIVDEMGDLPFRPICLPPSIRAGDVTETVCGYFSEEPDVIASSGVAVVTAALLHNYPCE